MPEPTDATTRDGISALAILQPCAAHPAAGEHELLTVQFEIPSYESLSLRLRSVVSRVRISDLILAHAPTRIFLEKD